jgi:hypothetical protein
MSTYGKTKRLKMHGRVKIKKNKKDERKRVIVTGQVGLGHWPV